MAKIKTRYVCSNCSNTSPKWMGKCSECGEWNSFEEETDTPALETKYKDLSEDEGPRAIKDIEREDYRRVSTGIGEFDRVVGGGVVAGSLILIGGEPGIGKSTLLTEVVGKLAKNSSAEKVLYVSGEESVAQVAERSRRLGMTPENMYIYHECNWQRILSHINNLKPKFLVIDSIQTTVTAELQSAPGTVSQIREVTYELMNHVKAKGITCFVIGHITKEGSIAGPKILEHMVDTVVYFEGDQFGHYRMLRAIKNRFGNTNEVGIFEMGDEGLVEVANPSQYFLDTHIEGSFGRSLTCITEGTRSLFVETQALVVENKYGNGRRTTQGVDSNRLAMLVAVIEKYLGLPLGFSDIYLNIVGGIKLESRESDLSIIASLISSYKNKPIDDGIIFIGEVGLTGEIRMVPRMEQRLKEMAQLNYKLLVTSEKIAEKYKDKFNIKIKGIKKAKELEAFFA